MVMRAASVEPVGLNPNWSAKFNPCGGVCIAGYMNALTICLSNKHDSIGIMEMGL